MWWNHGEVPLALLVVDPLKPPSTTGMVTDGQKSGFHQARSLADGWNGDDIYALSTVGSSYRCWGIWWWDWIMNNCESLGLNHENEWKRAIFFYQKQQIHERWKLRVSENGVYRYTHNLPIILNWKWWKHIGCSWDMSGMWIWISEFTTTSLETKANN